MKSTKLIVTPDATGSPRRVKEYPLDLKEYPLDLLIILRWFVRCTLMMREGPEREENMHQMFVEVLPLSLALPH